MMSNEMVERVRKIIMDHFESGSGSVVEHMSDQDEIDLARAVIEAMREPDHGMLHTPEAINYPTKLVDLLWKSMIDAALKH